MNAVPDPSAPEFVCQDIENAPGAAAFRELTFEAYRPQLAAFEQVAAVGATSDGRPVGLALARLDEAPVAHVISLFVAPEWRRCGCAAALLKRLERRLGAAGCAQADITYRSGLPATPGLEALLAREGWSAPRVRQIYCRTNGRKMQEAQWIFSMKLPAEYEIVPWSSVTDRDRESIRARQAAAPFFPDELNPLRHEEGYEPVNSLGLRFKGEIVGWLITHPAAGGAIRYTCSYLRPDLQSVGRLVALYGEALKRQIAAQGLDCVGIWTVPVNIPRMAAFVRRRFAPYLLDLAEFRFSRKRLLPGDLA